jgi:hypothetical protein
MTTTGTGDDADPGCREFDHHGRGTGGPTLSIIFNFDSDV